MRRLLLLAISFASVPIAFSAPLTVRVAGDFYEGGPRFEVLADGEQVGAGTVENRDSATFKFEAPDDASEIAIRFVNDRSRPATEGPRPADSDRNLIIQSVSLGEQTWNGADFAGTKGRARGTDLVLYTNAEVVLQVSESTAPTTDELVESPVTPSELSCDVRAEISGFENGAVELTENQRLELAPVLQVKGCEVLVTGYSSTSGPVSLNKRVALARAQAVLDHLMASGAEFSKSEIVSGGETSMFGEDQAPNRRVIVELK